MWANDSEVLETLWWRGIRDVYDDTQIVTNGPNLAFKGTWQGTLWELELERKLVVAPGHDRDVAFFILVWNIKYHSVIHLYSFVYFTLHAGMQPGMFQLFRRKQSRKTIAFADREGWDRQHEQNRNKPQ